MARIEAGGTETTSALRRLGAHWDGHGTHFVVWSGQASSLELCLADSSAFRRERRVPMHAAGDGLWHLYVRDARPGQRYGFRADGPYRPREGLRFNVNKRLVDPYARAIEGRAHFHPLLLGYPAEDGFALGDPRAPELDARDSTDIAPWSVVVDTQFDWDGDAPPRTALHDSVIYECHVKGLTARHPGVAPDLRGTYLGLASDPVVEHLRALGITAVELLPVAHSYSDAFLVKHGLCNYWGYDGIGYFAPDERFAAEPGAQVHEFKRMVRALHRAGIEVLLDVVYNHSGEGSEFGPTLCLRGLGNNEYYQQSPQDPSYTVDFTGCGNTLALAHRVTRQLVLDCLHYWVSEMHVDGFRFDLAPALARSLGGLDLARSVFADIARDPILREVKLIVEPWDIAGVARGQFGAPYAEWNDLYRDGVRKFFRGDAGQLGEIARRLSGSSDLFAHDGRSPSASVNFVACHDGFTLRDLLSYEQRHNQANGWDGKDGSSDNISRNFGVEGPTEQPEVNRMRERAARSMLATLSFSLGVPMLLQGDEIGRTQGGNNNPYGQDNETSWVDWKLGPSERALLESMQEYLRLRRELGAFRRSAFFTGELVRATQTHSPEQAGPHVHPPQKDVSWLRPQGGEMHASDWNDSERRAIGMWVCGHTSDGAPDLAQPSWLLILNGGHVEVRFALPRLAAVSAGWELLIDTAYPERAPSGFAWDAISVGASGVCLLRKRCVDA